MRAATAEPIDWHHFLAIVRRQRVEGLASSALQDSGVHIPEEVARPLHSAAEEIVRQNLAFASESLRLKRLFDQADIPLLFVKGVTLSMLAYKSLAVKKAWDIDAAVPPESINEACELLARSGYIRELPEPELSAEQFQAWLSYSKETAWRHERTGIYLELHSALVDNVFLLPGVNARSAQQSVPVSPGVGLPTLHREELFSYLCVHGATHAWSRLKWLADVAALLSHEDEAGVESLFRQSVRLGAGRSSAQALLLCQLLLGTRLPARLARELRKDPVNRWLVRIALKMMAGKNAERELDDTVLGTLPIHASHFMLARGVAYKAFEAKRKMLSPYDRARLDLPRSLHFLYPILLLPNWVRRRMRIAAAP